MLFLMVIFFYVSNSLASQDYSNSATLKLDCMLEKIVYPAIDRLKHENEINAKHAKNKRIAPTEEYIVTLSIGEQDKIIACIKKHFDLYVMHQDDSDYVFRQAFACQYLKRYVDSHRIDRNLIQKIMTDLDEIHTRKDHKGVCPMLDLTRDQSGGTDKESCTIGSYGSTSEYINSIMSPPHSPGSRKRFV